MIKFFTYFTFTLLLALSQVVIADENNRDVLIADVVSDQIDAFSKDDGERAFSHASPKIKSFFRNPTIFMRMVKRSYGMVYRPKTHTIEDTVELGDKIFLPVLFTDQKNQLFKIFYEMQQQEDKSWKINGVSVLQPKGIAA